MIVAGVMSGTSADGVDVAVLSIQGRGSYLSFDLLLHDHSEYPPAIRKAVLAAMNASKISVAELSRLNFRLGEFYAEAVSRAQKKSGQKKLDLVGCHGQTIYHQGTAAPYLEKISRAHGRRVKALYWRPDLECRWSRIFDQRTWPQAVKVPRWFRCSTMRSFVLPTRGESCKISAGLPTSPRFLPAARRMTLWLLILVPETW